MTVNGASVRTGDLFASGTVCGPERDQRGCLLELSWGGAEPLTLPDGSVRSFLADGDEVTISATAPAADGARIGLGEVTGQIQRARRRSSSGPGPLTVPVGYPLPQLLAVKLAYAGERHRGHDRDLPRVLVARPGAAWRAR